MNSHYYNIVASSAFLYKIIREHVFSYRFYLKYHVLMTIRFTFRRASYLVLISSWDRSTYSLLRPANFQQKSRDVSLDVEFYINIASTCFIQI